jgi:hypothetical protein
MIVSAAESTGTEFSGGTGLRYASVFVPEPTTLGLLALAGTALLARRRK